MFVLLHQVLTAEDDLNESKKKNRFLTRNKPAPKTSMWRPISQETSAKKRKENRLSVSALLQIAPGGTGIRSYKRPLIRKGARQYSHDLLVDFAVFSKPKQSAFRRSKRYPGFSHLERSRWVDWWVSVLGTEELKLKPLRFPLLKGHPGLSHLLQTRFFCVRLRQGQRLSVLRTIFSTIKRSHCEPAGDTGDNCGFLVCSIYVSTKSWHLINISSRNWRSRETILSRIPHYLLIYWC